MPDLRSKLTRIMATFPVALADDYLLVSRAIAGRITATTETSAWRWTGQVASMLFWRPPRPLYYAWPYCGPGRHGSPG